VTFIVQNPNPTGLVASVGHTRALQPAEIGTAHQAMEVTQTIRRMVGELKAQREIDNEKDVKLVLIKCPLLTSAKIAAIKAQDLKPITEDTYESMAKSRYASAIGIALGLNEMNEEDATGFMDREAKEFYSNKASCSSGAELEDCHILILASVPLMRRATMLDDLRTPKLNAMAGSMIDAIDAVAITEMLKEIKKRGGAVVQVFVKAEADPSGMIRGSRHTMNTDSDIHSTRHARAAVGGLVAGLLQDTMVYVSGGAEGQGPSGGGSLCMIYSVEGA
jgi:cyanuric acid amidohydrolase